MAGQQGFEPWIPSLVYSLSRGALSTTQPLTRELMCCRTAVKRTYGERFVNDLMIKIVIFFTVRILDRHYVLVYE